MIKPADKQPPAVMGPCKLIREPLIWLFGLGAVCMGGGDISTFVFLPKIGTNTLDMSQDQAHRLIVFIGISGIVGCLAIGHVLKAFRPLTIWNVGIGGAVVCFALFPFLSDYTCHLQLSPPFTGCSPLLTSAPKFCPPWTYSA